MSGPLSKWTKLDEGYYLSMDGDELVDWEEVSLGSSPQYVLSGQE